jgi:hypothetical protein
LRTQIPEGKAIKEKKGESPQKCIHSFFSLMASSSGTLSFAQSWTLDNFHLKNKKTEKELK